MAQYHLKINEGDVGAYCLLPGDPGRCEVIAQHLDNPRFLSQNREFCIYIGALSGVRVGVCSTGIGAPSAAIAMEELFACGVRNFIRVGTCGGMDPKVKPGDCVIASAAVRRDGTGLEYAPIEYPAAADFHLTELLVQSAKALHLPFHVGVVQAKDSFYGQHAPERMPVAADLLARWEAYKRLGVLASEMESGALYCVAASLRARCGCVLHTVWNQTRAAEGLVDEDQHNPEKAIRVAIGAIGALIAEENA